MWARNRKVIYHETMNCHAIIRHISSLGIKLEHKMTAPNFSHLTFIFIGKRKQWKAVELNQLSDLKKNRL